MIPSHSLTRQVQRFAVSGLLVTGFHVLVAAGLIRLVQLAPAPANGLAFVMAILFSYVINTSWSFSSSLHGKNLLRFVLVSIVGLILAVSISGLAEFYGLHYWLGIAGVICVVTPVNFLLHSLWTYK